MLLIAAFAVISMTGCYSTPNSGEIGVVRNGGRFDNKNIRGIVHNGQGNTWVGLFSTTHYYPTSTQQRIFKLETGPDGQEAKGADAPAITVPSADGVQTEISGTFYFKTKFDGSAQGDALLKKFDSQFGTRTFPGGKHAWEDWGAFLTAIVQPVVDSNMREVVSGFECKQLQSSCALVQNAGNQKAPDLSNTNNKSNVAQVQDAVNKGLVADLKEKLGDDYFADIQFNLQAVQLPGVQEAINQAQQAFAEVSRTQADVQKAKVQVDVAHQQRLANTEKQKGYNACKVCGKIDQLKALPSGLKVLGGSAATLVDGR